MLWSGLRKGPYMFCSCLCLGRMPKQGARECQSKHRLESGRALDKMESLLLFHLLSPLSLLTIFCKKKYILFIYHLFIFQILCICFPCHTCGGERTLTSLFISFHHVCPQDRVQVVSLAASTFSYWVICKASLLPSWNKSHQQNAGCQAPACCTVLLGWVRGLCELGVKVF